MADATGGETPIVLADYRLTRGHTAGSQLLIYVTTANLTYLAKDLRHEFSIIVNYHAFSCFVDKNLSTFSMNNGPNEHIPLVLCAIAILEQSTNERLSLPVISDYLCLKLVYRYCGYWRLSVSKCIINHATRNRPAQRSIDSKMLEAPFPDGSNRGLSFGR